jgi:FlaA1/EpsC-like NDP-sugar epimerase
MQRNPHMEVEVIGLLDDDPAKHGVRIHGVAVLGGRQDIPRLVQQYRVRQVIIAMPAAPGKAIREVVKICEQAGVKTRTMPGLSELLRDRERLGQLRDVQIEDLLRRAPVQTDIAAVRELIRGRRVLVTGGGGSIGSELCRQILRCEPSELIVIGHGENSVFAIGNELQQTIRDAWRERQGGRVPPALHTVIADIRSADRLRTIFAAHQPQIVFHAAAHKHVPLMEANPAEAITNNVLGTRNLLACAQQVGVERFVMISTDKAVNPTSVMGASKRTAELLVHHAALTSGRPYVAVRFGNVLGSRGSVVLTFKQQIANGGPITVTHPEITRYFMTIPEAVQLVLQAAVLGQGGKIFMLDMGEPVKIVDLARDMIELSGLEVGQDIEIVFSGLRPGEKLYEELFIPGEEYQPTRHEKISIAVNASMVSLPNLHELVNALTLAAERDDHASIRRLLKTLVPEYQGGGKVENGEWRMENAGQG